jgi:hypothetical protein
MFDVLVTMLEMGVGSRCLFLANDMTEAFPLLLEMWAENLRKDFCLLEFFEQILVYTHPLSGTDDVWESWHLVIAIRDEGDGLILEE